MKLLASRFGCYHPRKSGKVYTIDKYLDPKKKEELLAESKVLTNMKATKKPEDVSGKRKSEQGGSSSGGKRKPIVFDPINKQKDSQQSFQQMDTTR